MNSVTRRCGATLLVILASCHKAATPPPAAVPVSVAPARRMDVPHLIPTTGTVEPIETAQVQPQITGQLMHVRFTEGQEVTAGQVLFEIDPRPFQAALQQAQAAASRDLASWESARRDVQRYESLASKEYVTQQQLDQTRAQADALSGTVHGDSAMIDQAKLNLQYATIRAPISGRAGSLLVKEGNQVRTGGQTLVVINQISPILVRFAIKAADFDAVRRRADQGLEVRAAPVGDSSHYEVGSLVFLDNAVDSNTGTVWLKARFPNKGGALWPGALEAVLLQLDVEKNALVVPSSAVQSGQSGSVVWVVDSSKRAHAVKVVVERSSDSLTVLSSGVAEGVRVVTDGQLRLTDSVRVAIRDSNGAPGAHDSAAGGTLATPGKPRGADSASRASRAKP
jgi:multidrug efflux system membrane fusion protein